MKNVCQIFCKKTKKMGAFGLVLCLICGLVPPAAGISTKLRGKIALGGILTGLASVTYVLVTRDTRATAALQRDLGPPDHAIQFERGFDRWRITSYGEKCYLFRNNLFVKTVPCPRLQSDFLISEPPHHLPSVYSRAPDMSLRSLFPGVVAINQNPFRDEREQSAKAKRLKQPFLIDTSVSRRPKWLWLYPLRPQRAPQFVSSYLYRWEAGRLLGLAPLLLH